MLAIGGTEPGELRTMMELEMEKQGEHEDDIPKVSESAGGFSPTIGIIGAILGLIQVMQHLERREGLVVSLKEIGFFDSGSATIRPTSLDAIARLAGVLKQRPENLRIEGHTDNVPIHTPRFSSNWELSTSRATDLIKILIMTYGIPPSHLAAAGYGEFHPVAKNDTPEGRAQNRRLDVVILSPL